jgi:PIN domain nuclease of toxin-antitoxin system
VRLLLDTHILLWVANGSDRLSNKARAMIEDDEAELLFSALSIWEVAIKTSRGRPDFHYDPALLRRTLLREGYVELPILGVHAEAVIGLPHIHKDPFDRILIAQAMVERAVLLTADKRMARYSLSVRKV